MSFEVLASGRGLVEGPTVDADGSLYFSDVLGGGVYRRAPDGALEEVIPKRRGVGGIALHADGGLVVSGRDVVHVREGETRVLLRIEGLHGWNDLCADGRGRVVAGALRFAVFDRDAEPVPGECWRTGEDGRAERLYGNLVHANGVALGPDERCIVHSDTRRSRLVVHDLDAQSRAENRREWPTHEVGPPDGLAFDTAGCVWVAAVGGGKVARYTPEGRLDGALEVPARLVTSLCFGGDDGRDLYVTTADHTERPELRGCVLRTRVAQAGLPVPPARV